MKIFTIFFFSIPLVGYSQSNDSLKLIELERKIMNDSIRIENLIKENKAKDSLLNQIQIQVRDNKVAKDFYSLNIGTLSVVITIVVGVLSLVFSILIGIILFVFGYLLPKDKEKKFQQMIENLNKEISELIESVELRTLRTEIDINRSMYYINKNHLSTQITWAVTIINLYYKLYQKIEKEETKELIFWWVNRVKDLLNNITTKSDAKFLKEFELRKNRELSEIIDIEKSKEIADEELHKILIELRDQYNQTFWSKLTSK